VSHGKLGSEDTACTYLLLHRHDRRGRIAGSGSWDEVKNRDVAKALWLKTDWKRAEENGSFAKRMEMWCAKVPRGNVCPRCVVLRQSLADKKVAFVWAQREVDRSLGRTLPDLTAEDVLVGPCGLSKLSTPGDLQNGGQVFNLTPLGSHVSFGWRVGTRVEWKEVSEEKSCGRLEHCRSRQVEIVLAHHDPVMMAETSRGRRTIPPM
jgi:hypothetical protein